MRDHKPTLDLKRINSLVQRAKHREAFILAQKLHRAYPNNPEVQYEFAVLLGDNTQGIKKHQAERNRLRCVALLKQLLPKTAGVDALTRYRIRNEYFWFTRQHRKQYLLGTEGLRSGIKKAYYSQGVGAAWHALKLAEDKQTARAAKWAERSVVAWRKFLAKNEYYNAYVHLGLALGVMGRKKEMEEALKRGAKVAGASTNFHEFSEIRKRVGQLPT